MQRLLLREGVSYDDIDDALAEGGYRLVNVVPESPGVPPQLIFATGDRRALVHLVEDKRLDILYFFSPGEGGGASLERLGERLPFYDDEAVDGLLRAARDDASLCRALALLALSIGASPTEERVSSLRGALRGGSVLVRSAALAVISYSPLEALRPELEALAGEVDGDPALRFGARQLLERFYSSPEDRR